MKVTLTAKVKDTTVLGMDTDLKIIPTIVPAMMKELSASLVICESVEIAEYLYKKNVQISLAVKKDNKVLRFNQRKIEDEEIIDVSRYHILFELNAQKLSKTPVYSTGQNDKKKGVSAKNKK